MSIYSNNAFSPSFAKSGDTVRLDFTSSEPISIPQVMINNHLVSVYTTSSTSFYSEWIVVDSDNQGNIQFVIYGYYDNAQNNGANRTTVSDGSHVRIGNSLTFCYNM